MPDYRPIRLPGGTYFFTVKHGHVARVADWPYSSFHRLVAVGVYPRDWADEGREDLAAGERG